MSREVRSIANRNLFIVAILLALGFTLTLPTHPRAQSQIKPEPLSAGRAVPAAVPAQPRQYEFVEHVIDQVRGCEGNPLRSTRNTSVATYNFTFTSGTEVGCTAVTIPNGVISLNFPATFTDGVAFTPTINTTGTLQLRVASNHFTVSGKGLTVDAVLNRLPIREALGVDQDLRNAPCPLARFRQNPPLNGGTEAVPGPNPFARNASCSVTAPALFQSFEGNNVLIISTIDIVVGEDPIGPPDFFSYRGIRLLRFTVTSKYRPATTTCPGLTLQNGVASSQNCPAALRIDMPTEAVASGPCPVVVTARKQDGSLDTSFNGTVQVSLAPGSTPKIGCLKSGNQCAASLSVALQGGILTQFLSLQTPLLEPPGRELDSTSVLRPGDPVLEGKAVIKAESGTVAAPEKDVNVKSPLDLKIDRIEVQQAIKPEKDDDLVGPWVQFRDLLIRVFLDANRTEFNKYLSIRDITADLTVRDRTGSHIEGSPFTLSLGAFTKGTSSPSQPYVFTPILPPDELGSESLNHVLYVKQDRLSIEVKLNDVYKEKDASNNSKSLPPLTFTTSKRMTFLYSPARLKAATQNSGCPTEAGIAREINLLQLAYPVSFPESVGRMQFIPVPNPTANESCEALTADPLPRRAASRWWFWLNRTKRSDVRGWVYFVDRGFFSALNMRHAGLTNAVGGSISVVSDRCLAIGNISQCGILAHEIGHMLSLGDTYTQAGAVPNPSVNPPQGDAEGNPVGRGTFSWFHHRFSLTPTDFIDFMGATFRAWTDRVNWNYLRLQLLPASNAGAQTEQPTLTAEAAADSFVIVAGEVRKDGSAELSNCYTLTGEDLANSSNGAGYIIETLDGSSNVVNTLSFAPTFKPPHVENELDSASFSFALPFSSAVRQLRLRSGANILATRQVSANSPVISFTSDFGGQTLNGTKAVTWSGMDADGQPLTYSLFYSPDGELQVPLVLDTSATSYQWNTDDVASGSTPKLTLTATDGVNATIIESSTFTIANRAPRLVIVSPGDRQQFKLDEPVILEGWFHDPEDGIDLRAALNWSSNLQGALGTGRQLVVNNLATGTHLITVSGADSQGKPGSASLTVIVRPDNFSNIETTPASADFGTVAVGEARDLAVSVRNTGNAPFAVTGLTGSNPQFRVIAPATPFIVAVRSQQDLLMRFTPLTAGSQTGSLTVASNASNQTALNVALMGGATGPSAGAFVTVSAASYSTAPLAREAIVAGFGVTLAGSTELAASVPLPTQLAGTSVKIKDSTGRETFAPLFFVSPGQINWQIPTAVAYGPATISVTSASGAISIGVVTIVAVSPGVFTANADGKGVPAGFAIRVKPGGAQSTEAIARYDTVQTKFLPAAIDFGPAGDELVLVLFGTGWRYRSSLAAVSCVIDGVAATVGYAGAQGSFVGLDQINIGLPRSLAGRGEVDLVLTVDGLSNTVRLAFAASTPICNYTISPTSQNFTANGGIGSVNVPAPVGCAWTATSNALWLAITAGSQGNGPGAVNYFVASNTTTSQRTGTLTIAAQTFTVTQAAGASTVTVLARRTSLGPIPADCAPPDLKVSFLTTDASVFQWTLVTGAHIGDQVRWEFSPVSGGFLQTAQYTVQFEGSLCFWGSMLIAGSPASSFTGNWQVRVFYNNALLLTDNFTINAP